jgi:2'-5' RNA ligase
MPAMYYIALLAPEAVNKQVLQWKYRMRNHFGCTVALKSPAHITLAVPFWMDEAHEASLLQSIAAYTAGTSLLPLTISLKNFDAFAPRVIYVNVVSSPALVQLQAQLETHLLAQQLFPLKKETRAFHPHITIANRDLLKKDFASAWQHFAQLDYATSFTIHTISLLRLTDGRWLPCH